MFSRRRPFCLQKLHTFEFQDCITPILRSFQVFVQENAPVLFPTMSTPSAEGELLFHIPQFTDYLIAFVQTTASMKNFCLLF